MIVIVTAIWKRPEVFQLFIEGIKRLGEPITVVVAGSEGEQSRRMVLNAGFTYVETPNEPLSEKHNRAIQEARRFRPSHLLFLGSDDIITPELFQVYKDCAAKGIDFVGLLDFYFYDAIKKRSAYWGGYIDKRKGMTVGAGRMLSKKLLDSWNWRVFERRHSKILDDSIQEKLARKRHTSYIFSLKSKGMYAIDIKSEINMTPFQLWPNTKFIPNAILKPYFPYVYE